MIILISQKERQFSMQPLKGAIKSMVFILHFTDKYILYMAVKNKISVEDYAKTGKLLSRRNKPVSPSYIYRLIRKHNKGEISSVPFSYEMTGDKDRIWIILK